MRRVFFLILLCLASMPIGISTAQNNCTINLEESILQLVQAQRAADTGDTLLATSLLQSVQNGIDTITTGCETIGLTEKYTSPDESLTFSYPEGWRVQTIEGGPIIVASSPALIDILDNDLPESIPAGEAAIALLMQPVDDTFDDSLDELMDEIRDEFRILGAIDDSVIKGRRVVSMSIAFNANVSGHISLIDYSDTETSTAMLVFGLADSASLPIIEAYTSTLVKSIQYPPVSSLRNIGVAMESLSYSEVVVLAEDYNISPSIPASLSPDGTTLAWQGPDGLCIQEHNQSAGCTALPERFSGRTPLLQWSPDGRYITFQENALVYFVDADVWLFDVEESSVINLTDDGDAEFGFGDFETDIWLDTVMTWGPDNQIYLLRTTIEAGNKIDDRIYELLRIDPDTGNATVIQDLTQQFEMFPVYYPQQYSLDGVMSVSPDASQMVISVTEQDRESPNNGIWLLDLSGTDEPQQVGTIDQFMTGYNAELYEEASSYTIESLAWDADGTGLFVYAQSPRDVFQFNMVYHLDLDNGDIVPLVDMTEYTLSDLPNSDDPRPSASEFIPITPVLSPDYRAVIVANHAQTRISAIPFDGQFSEPITLMENEDIKPYGATAMVGSNGALLMGGNLFISD